MPAPFARALLGWKRSTKNKLGWLLVPNFADVDNAESMRIGAALLDYLGVWPACDASGTHPARIPRTGLADPGPGTVGPAAGLVVQRRRNGYAVPAGWVIACVVLVAARSGVRQR